MTPKSKQMEESRESGNRVLCEVLGAVVFAKTGIIPDLFDSIQPAPL